jgi:hypothetical protein
MLPLTRSVPSDLSLTRPVDRASTALEVPLKDIERLRHPEGAPKVLVIQPDDDVWGAVQRTEQPARTAMTERFVQQGPPIEEMS